MCRKRESNSHILRYTILSRARPVQMVPRERIELSHLTIHDFESCASTNSATAASFKRDKSTNLPAGRQVPPFRHTSDFTLKRIYCLEKIGPRAFAPGPLLTTEQRKLQTIRSFCCQQYFTYTISSPPSQDQALKYHLLAPSSQDKLVHRALVQISPHEVFAKALSHFYQYRCDLSQ